MPLNHSTDLLLQESYSTVLCSETIYIYYKYSLFDERLARMFHVPCKKGSIQVTDDGFVRIVRPFRAVIWQVPANSIQAFYSKPKFVTTTMMIQSTQGSFMAEMVTLANFAKLAALFPGAPITVLAKQQPFPVVQGMYQQPAHPYSAQNWQPSHTVPGSYAPTYSSLPAALLANQPHLSRQQQPGSLSWWQKQTKKTKIGLGCLGAVVVLFLCTATLIASAGSSTASPSASLTHTNTIAMVKTTPTAAHTPTARPTASPTHFPTPTPQPTRAPQPTPQPKPTPNACADAVGGNPYCYTLDADGGSLIYSPAGGLCDYVSCVSTFWKDTNGYVALCNNGKYTHSAGVSGACSRDGGVDQPLYSH